MQIADEQYVVISTQAGTGESASGRARVVPLSDGRLGLWVADDLDLDGQVVTVRAERAEVADLHGTAQVVRSGRAFDEATAKLRRKYGWRARLAHPDTIVVLQREPPT